MKHFPTDLYVIGQFFLHKAFLYYVARLLCWVLFSVITTFQMPFTKVPAIFIEKKMVLYCPWSSRRGCIGVRGVLVRRQYKVALNCLVGVTLWAARCSLEQVENQKRMFANLFWTMFKSKEVRESGVRWKWVTIYACTQWLGSERQMQRCSGNPNWLSAGPKLLEGKGPLLLGLAFLTLSFTSLSSTWVASEESLGPECLGQRHRINIDFKLLNNLELGPGVCLLPSVSSRTSTFTQQAKHISGPLFIDYSFENLPAP